MSGWWAVLAFVIGGGWVLVVLGLLHWRWARQKEALILAMLRDRGEMSGLEMVGASDGKLSRGSVYVVLSALQDKGLVLRRDRAGVGTGIGHYPLHVYRLAAAPPNSAIS